MLLQLFFHRIITFPLWWYGAGFVELSTWMRRKVVQCVSGLALGVWIKNLFVPMYGDTSFIGRAISFFLRLIMISARSIFVCLYTLLLIFFLFFYLMFPAVTLMGLLYSLGLR